MKKIIERINLISENENVKLTSMEKEIGASKGVLSRAFNNKTDIQSKWITKIVENYSNYNSEWLLTGKGDMIKDSYNQSIKGDGNYMAGKNLHNNSNDFIINNLKTIIKEKDTIIKEKDIIIKELLAHQKKLIDKL